ncbi:hypothetical protein L2719_20865, partial [Shewanella schlegeliana]|uniref:hypothetical protein n=1 Tax=Shewanella schlegeliana TaxID=190308 RepID=UPI00200C645E
MQLVNDPFSSEHTNPEHSSRQHYGKPSSDVLGEYEVMQLVNDPFSSEHTNPEHSSRQHYGKPSSD